MVVATADGRPGGGAGHVAPGQGPLAALGFAGVATLARRPLLGAVAVTAVMLSLATTGASTAVTGTATAGFSAFHHPGLDNNWLIKPLLSLLAPLPEAVWQRTGDAPLAAPCIGSALAPLY